MSSLEEQHLCFLHTIMPQLTTEASIGSPSLPYWRTLTLFGCCAARERLVMQRMAVVCARRPMAVMVSGLKERYTSWLLLKNQGES